MFCSKQYYLENRAWTKDFYLENRDRIKEYQLKNHDKIITQRKIYSNNRYKTDNNFRLICKTRSRIRLVLRVNEKSSSIKDVLRNYIDIYRKWFEYHFTPEMN